MPIVTVTGQHLIAALAAIAAEHRLCVVGPLARTRLIGLLQGDTGTADQLINTIVCQTENDPVYMVECERLPNPIALAATSTDDLADKVATYLTLYADLPCEVTIDLTQGDGRVHPVQGGTSPLFIREVAPTYTIAWMTPSGPREMKDLTADQINATLGQNLAKRASCGWVTNIVVTSEEGRDVTAEFDLFRTDTATIVPFAEAHIVPGATALQVVAHLDGLVQRYPHLWRAIPGANDQEVRAFQHRTTGLMTIVDTADQGRAYMELPLAIRRVNCIALDLPLSTPAEAIDRLIRIARGHANTPRRILREWATSEVPA
ncbi:hypothetical protein [Nonomuraea endophytica]|uniref:hypothetical protein n=1 Tax=Nonomuraea endophytica TaxID=714136 RepID=UPI0037C8873E